ncbi:MAG TPA: FecR family protein [Pseudomonadales bacterium]|nr:FecR family protein [Pseudomonadales bacterium]
MNTLSRIILARIVSGIFFIAATFYTWAETPPVGLVLATAGTVQIQRGTQQIPAERKTALQVNDTIKTGDNARAQLRFADGTITTLGANTGFVIKQFDWTEKQTTQANVQLELLAGAFRSVTGKALDVAGSRFGVKTPVGVIGIRGTDFWGGYLDPDAVDVLLIDGKHAVEVSNTNGKVLLEKPGQGTTLKADQSGLVVKEWPKTKVSRAVATITWPDGSTPPTE